jgi:prephenate dehydrogenase
LLANQTGHENHDSSNDYRAARARCRRRRGACVSTVVVVGLGLVGGSVALGVRAGRPHWRIVGIDLDCVVRSQVARALADQMVSVDDRGRVDAVVAGADLTVLATPVATICELLPRVLERARVVTDCGSTKRTICALAARSARSGRFVPGHPMAGGPIGGARHARPDLFKNRSWILCKSDSDADALVEVEKLVDDLGAQRVYMDVAEHDRAVALTSHLPQLLASALTVIVDRHGAARAAGPAFESASRVSGGAEAMWRDIFASNADEVAAAVKEMGIELTTVLEGLRAEPPDPARAQALLARARTLRGTS